MKQLALALHNYISATGPFPPGIDNTATYLGSAAAGSARDLDGLERPGSCCLPYVEQGPLYNAANFSWNCCYADAQGDATNFTVYNTQDRQLPLPVRRHRRAAEHQQLLRQYRDVDHPYPGDGNTTGVFRVYNSVNACCSVTLAAITDGTSNTIAFGEGLVGDYGRKNNYKGNGMSGAETSRRSAGLRPRSIAGNNAESDPAAVLQALQSCNAFWSGSFITTCVGPYGCDSTGLKQYTGQTWALGERGYTLVQHDRPAELETLPVAQLPPYHLLRLCARKGRVSSMPTAIIPAGATSHSATGASGSSRIRSTC